MDNFTEERIKNAKDILDKLTGIIGAFVDAYKGVTPNGDIKYGPTTISPGINVSDTIYNTTILIEELIELWEKEAKDKKPESRALDILKRIQTEHPGYYRNVNAIEITPSGEKLAFWGCSDIKDPEPELLASKKTTIENIEFNKQEENTMTNAEMAKQIKEFSEKLDRYFANQEETINKYDDKIIHLHNELEELSERVNGLGIVAQETTRQLKEQTDRLNRYRDVQDKQFATYDSKIEQLETALMQLRLNISSISCVYGIPEEAKTIESIYPCLWACVHRGKECNGLAQECPIAEHFCNLLENGILFSEFNAGKRAIVFDGNDPRFEATYMDFCRAYDEWCHTSEKDDKLYPRSTWKVRDFRMNPLMKCPSIYKDHASFAIWTEWVDEKSEPTFEYGTLQSTWREHKTVGRLPYTVWGV